MEIQDIGESLDLGVRRLLHRVSEAVVQSQTSLPLGYSVGDVVYVWSNMKSRWIHDGIVEERTNTERCINGLRLPAGSLKIKCEGGKLVQWVLPTEVRELIRKIPRVKPRPPLKLLGTSDGMLQHLREVEQQCLCMSQKYSDPAFTFEKSWRISHFMRPRDVDRHEGNRLCPEVEASLDIFGTSSVEKPSQPPNVDWQLFRGTPRSDDVQQGELGDCWLLSSLAVLAEFQEGRFVRALLPEQEAFSEVGAYVVRLCLGGSWTCVLIDDQFPCLGGGMFYTQFAYCQTKRLQVWASLIEKAFAKACGSYSALKGGEAAEALELFTGWPSQLYIHDWPDFDPELLWATLSSSRDFEFLMVCSTRRVWASGLESDHVYSLMDVHEINYLGKGMVRLLKIRNPNSKSKWQGDWSDSSSLWTTQLRARLECPEQGTPNVFFMAYDDFLKHFAHCTICKIRSNDWYELRKPIVIMPHQAPSESLLIEVFDTTEISLSLEQPSHRLRGGPFFPHLPGAPSSIGFVLVRAETSTVVSVLSSASINRRAIVSAECWLEPGRYLAVPLSLHNGPPLTATWACFSSRRVSLTHKRLSEEEIRMAWVAYVLDRDPVGVEFHCGSMHIGKGVGGCIVAFAKNPPNSGMFFNVKLELKSNCLQYSRGIGETSDWLAPGEGQILNFTQPEDSWTGDVAWWNKHTFEMTKATPAGPKSLPLVRPGDLLHTPFSLLRRRREGQCRDLSCSMQ